MGQQTRIVREASQTINAFGQKLIIPLQKGMIARELMLRLSGGVTQPAANNLAANLGRGDEWSIFDRVDIVANGSDVVRSFPGHVLKIWNLMQQGTVPRVSPFLGDGATANPNFDSVITIPFWMLNALSPMDTALDTRDLADFRMELTIGPATSLSSNATPPSAIAATLDVYSYESFGVTGPFSTTQIYPLQAVVAGANPNFDMLLPVTGVYRGFLFNFAAAAGATAADTPNYQIGTNAQLLTATGITNVQVISGTQIYRDINTRVLQDWQRQRTNTDRSFVQNAAASPVISLVQPQFMNRGKSTNLVEDAWYWLDLVQDGYLTEAIDTVGLAEFKLRFNVAAAGTITLMPYVIYPLRNTAGK